MAPDRIRDLLITALVRGRGGERGRWRRAIGDIRVYPIETHPHCNWRVDPSGSLYETEAIERAVDLLAAEHPLIG